jgi:hypothetical protein
MSMFSIVADMNERFGNPKGSPIAFKAEDPNIYKDAVWAKLKAQCKNILAEHNELMSAIVLMDLEDTRDALCDIMVFALGAYHMMGIDADPDMQAVIDGVLTRFCKNQEELDATVGKYRNMDVVVVIEGEFPFKYVKSACDQQMPEFPKDKFLKSVGYKLAKFPPV